MIRALRDRVVLMEVVAIQWGSALARRTRDRLRKGREESGQTPTEYLMIVGLMAAVIVLVFVTFYWGNVKKAAGDWVQKVRDSIMGTKIN
jgi:Flp pilus assembly pilin Flp